MNSIDAETGLTIAQLAGLKSYNTKKTTFDKVTGKSILAISVEKAVHSRIATALRKSKQAYPALYNKDYFIKLCFNKNKFIAKEVLIQFNISLYKLNCIRLYHNL